MDRESGMDRDLLSSLQIWIRLPALPIRLWYQQIIIKVANLVGKPLYMDKATTSGERLTFARCFVEVAAAETLPCKIMLENDEVRKKYLMLSMSE